MRAPPQQEAVLDNRDITAGCYSQPSYVSYEYESVGNIRIEFARDDRDKRVEGA